MEAGVDKCDIFIAVSPHDETNIIAAITAKKLGANTPLLGRILNTPSKWNLSGIRWAST